MLKHFATIVIILLLVWISFFPAPIQQKYHLATKAFLLLSFVILLVRKRTSVFKISDFPLWVFLIAIGLNVFFAQERNTAFKTYLDLAIPLFSIYYLVSADFSTESRFNILAKTICICSILVALIGIFEVLFAVNPVHKYFIKDAFYQRYTIAAIVRPMSTQYNPAPLGSYLLACLPFSFFLSKQGKGSFKFLGATGVVLNTAIIILTFGRSILLGLLAMALFYLLVQKSYRAIIVLSVVVCSFVLICNYLPYPYSKYGTRSMLGDGGIQSTYHIDRRIMTQRIVKDHPLVGLGFQHFRIRFYEYYPCECEVPYEKRIADDMYLTILTETGIMGLLGFLIFMLSFLKRAWKKLNILNSPQRRLQLLIVLAAFIGLLVSMGGYEFFYWTNQYIYFCVLVGLIGAFFARRKRIY